MEAEESKIVLITGGAGFVGSNLAQRLLEAPNTVVRLFDNLSRSGVKRNLEWLKSTARPGQLEITIGDVRDRSAVRSAMRGVSDIYHLAAQVAVTSSIDDPMDDFDINALGTLNVLEAARRSSQRPFLLFTSTNKVYGSLHGVPVERQARVIKPPSRSFAGVTELEPLDFHSPYGCSKGSADQYVRDYARIYDLPTVVFRMSCIAGPRQFGNEDQGWVAHFLYSVARGQPITVYGDGFQVRDVLHVHDLLDAMQARASTPRTPRAGLQCRRRPERAVSVIEMFRAIERRPATTRTSRYSDVRPGDQPLYISDTAKLSARTPAGRRHALAQRHPRVHSSLLATATAICLLATRSPVSAARNSSPRRSHEVRSRQPPWSFEGSTYFGCAEPHFPLELLSARELLRAAGHEVLLVDALDGRPLAGTGRERLDAFGEDFLVIPTAPSYLFWRCPQPELRVPAQWIAALDRASHRSSSSARTAPSPLSPRWRRPGRHRSARRARPDPAPARHHCPGR